MNVYPCGYAAHADLIAWLMQSDPSLLLIDVRNTPRSSMVGWGFGELRRRYGTRYLWAGRALGNVNYARRGAYRLADAVAGIRGLFVYLLRGNGLLLLCGCPDLARCHLHLIVELVEAVSELWQARALGKDLPPDELPGERRASLEPLRPAIHRLAREGAQLAPQPPAVAIVHPDTVARPGYAKCLSITQPRAWMITHPGELTGCGLPPKTVENGDWTTPYRGRVFIHAGAKVARETFDPHYWRARFGDAGEALAAVLAGARARGEIATKAIVGVAVLESVVEALNDVWYVPGSYGFLLRDARPVGPLLDYPGRARLFDVPLAGLGKDAHAQAHL